MRIVILSILLLSVFMFAGCKDSSASLWQKVEGAWKSKENNRLSGKPDTFIFAEKTAIMDGGEPVKVTYSKAEDGVIIVGVIRGNQQWCVITPQQNINELEIDQSPYKGKAIFIKTSPSDVEIINKMKPQDNRDEKVPIH